MLHCDAKEGEHKILCKQVLLLFKMQMESKCVDPKILGFFLWKGSKNLIQIVM